MHRDRHLIGAGAGMNSVDYHIAPRPTGGWLATNGNDGRVAVRAVTFEDVTHRTVALARRWNGHVWVHRPDGSIEELNLDRDDG
jgi:hypothetical protein